ncbi:MAG: TIGR01841 family phasin [Pseudomonadota bacterium]|nr:TIGR01841 family phasin [Pseudomonadota bacterium]
MNYNYQFADWFKNALDYNQIFSTQRRNIEAASAATQAMVEGAQAVSRRGAEVIRSNVEDMLKASKDIMTGGSPEASISKQSEVARSIFENSLANLREITEMATKSGFEAFDVLNRRAAETLEEVSKACGSYSAASVKKKATA